MGRKSVSTYTTKVFPWPQLIDIMCTMKYQNINLLVNICMTCIKCIALKKNWLFYCNYLSYLIMQLWGCDDWEWFYILASRFYYGHLYDNCLICTYLLIILAVAVVSVPGSSVSFLLVYWRPVQQIQELSHCQLRDYKAWNKKYNITI